MPREEREKRAQALHRSGRAVRLRGQLPVAALRRHEAAHRDRPHARVRSGNPADGRAVRRARRADPQPDAERAARHLGAHAEDRDLRDPRRAGGRLPRRPRVRDVGAAGPHQGDRRHQVRQARRTSSAPRPSSRRSTRSGTWCARRRSRRRRSGRHEDVHAAICRCCCSRSPGRRSRGSSSSRRRALPPLTSVIAAWVELMQSGELITNGASSLYRAAAGLGLSIVVGTILGIVMAWWRAGQRAPEPDRRGVLPDAEVGADPGDGDLARLRRRLEDPADLPRLHAAGHASARSTARGRATRRWCGRRAAWGRTACACCGTWCCRARCRSCSTASAPRSRSRSSCW